MSETTPFYVDRAKGGRASCKGCKGNCPSGELRLAKLVASPYGENQSMKSWHHVDCFMNALLKQRPATKRVDSIDDIGNWENISKEDQEYLLKKLNETEKLYAQKHSGKYTAKVLKNESAPKQSIATPSSSSELNNQVETEDDKFFTFASLCKKIARVDAYTEKTAVVNNFFRNGTGNKFEGDLLLWCKLLLPQATKRVYNLKSKQLVKLFSKIFNTDQDDMLTHLEQGDIADTIQHFFSKARNIVPAKDSTLTIQNIENFLEELSKLTKEEEQIYHFKKIVKKCTLDDMKMLIRLIKGDLRINAGPKHILEGVHPDAYTAFQSSRDLNMVLDRVISKGSGVKHKDAAQSTVQAKISIMTPVLPMLAEACKSVEMAMKKCPNGMFSEIKYDGERVQVHKKGNEFKYFSRALKPVMPHKVAHFKDYLPRAFPKGTDLILDAEVLMVDVNTGKPLPFGTLGIHKQSEFKDAQVCLFVFDCLYYNGQVLIDMPIRKRRQFLYDNMVEVTNHIMFSEQQLIKKPADLAKMIAEVLQLGLEGLVLKDLESTYEPGKRHWLKVKKDYLFDGAMADTADLVVLGAWFGTGKKGGMMSVFLMGCLDKRRNKWVTVTKVHTGHDDSTLERLQKELGPLMNKISQDYHKLPSWIDCNKGMVPDFVAIDPKKQPVWEITGTELTKANLHTADGISVRFPRVTRIRTDKDWETATNLDELKHLFKTSKEKTDVSLLNKLAATASESNEQPKKKVKVSPKNVNKIDSFLIKKEKKSPQENKNHDSYNKDKTNIKDELNTSNSSSTSSSSRNKNGDVSDEAGENIKKEGERKRNRETKSHSANSSDSEDKRTQKVMHPEPNEMEIDQQIQYVNEIDITQKKKDAKKRKYKETKSDSSENKSDESRNTDDTIASCSKTKKKKKRRLSSSSTDYKHLEANHRIPNDAELDQQNLEDDEMRLNKKNTKKAKNKEESKDNTVPDKIILKFINEDDFEPENPLPDTFKDKRLGFYPDFISIPEEERMHFERHWIAYGGILVKSIRSMDVDYVVHNEEVISFKNMQKLLKKLESPARHVNKYWLIECINDCMLYDTTKFAVIVEP